jgi:hypothetical protein
MDVVERRAVQSRSKEGGMKMFNMNRIARIAVLMLGLAAVSRIADAEVKALVVQAAGLRYSDTPLMDADAVLVALAHRGANVQVLKDDQAKNQNIKAALLSMAQTSRPDDDLVVYYTGPGSRTSTGDWSLCPQDATIESDENDITGQTLQRWVASLSVNRVILILDCSFGTSPSKGPQHHNKTLPRPSSTAALPVRITGDKAILLLATQPGADALVEQIAPHKWESLFTFWFCHLLDKSPHQTTWREFHKMIAEKIQDYTKKVYDTVQQTPVLSGDSRQVDSAMFTRGASGTHNKQQEVAVQHAGEDPAVRAASILETIHNPGTAFRLDITTDKQVYKTGELLKAKVKVETKGKNPVFLTLICIDAQRNVRVVFPNRFWRDNRIQPGKTYEIPSSDEMNTFRYRISPPCGMEKLIALCSKFPIPWENFTQPTAGSPFPTVTAKGIEVEANDLQEQSVMNWVVNTTTYEVEDGKR